MELVERYVREVGRHLPEGLRGRVEEELRTTLRDALEDRLRDGPGEGAHAEVELLRDFGPPGRLARTYLPGRKHLIGPDLYQGFLSTLKICWSVLVLLFLLRVIFGWPGPGATLGQVGMGLLLSLHHLVVSAMTVLGVVVLLFASLDRTTARSFVSFRDWDPAGLPATDDRDRVARGGLVAGMALLSALLLLLNFFPKWIGIFTNLQEGRQFVPLLGPGFFSHLPLLNLCLLISLVQYFALLRLGSWSRLLRSVDLGRRMLLILLFARLLLGSSVLGLEAAGAPGHGLSEATVDLYEQVLLPILRAVLKVGFAAALIATAISTIRQVLRWR